MIGSIVGYSVNNAYFLRAQDARIAQQAAVQQNAGIQNAHQRSVQLERPVQPVQPTAAVRPETPESLFDPFARQGMDLVELGVRLRITPYRQEVDSSALTRQSGEQEPVGAEAVQAAAEEGECKTCAERKYQDGSDDMGVSFKTPTRVDPNIVAAAVRGHEMEHVGREQAKAQRENRRVVSQSVTYHTAICPECGKVYVSGGTTRTTTVAKPEQQGADAQAQWRKPFSELA